MSLLSVRPVDYTNIPSTYSIREADVSTETEEIKLYAGIVKDIILDDKHKLYNNASDILKIQFTVLSSKTNNTVLNYAYPLNNSMTNIPLVGEVVILLTLEDTYYYMDKVNIYQSVVNNSMGIVEPSVKSSQNSNYKEAQAGVKSKNANQSNEVKRTGVHSDLNYKVRPLQPEKGDILFQGRYGNSVRFGKQKLLFKVGVDNSFNGASNIPTTENLNIDQCSMWLIDTGDEELKFNASTKNSNYQLISKLDKEFKYTKNQIFLNSGRIVFNSVLNEILIFGDKSINMVSNGEITLDSNDYLQSVCKNFISFSSETGNIEMYSGDKFILSGDVGEFDITKLSLGRSQNMQPAVLGDELVTIFQELIDGLGQTKAIGPSGPSPIILGSKVLTLGIKLRNILSKNIKIS